MTLPILAGREFLGTTDSWLQLRLRSAVRCRASGIREKRRVQDESLEAQVERFARPSNLKRV
ncbi:hypothetical protein CO174_02730 [Candidatus Uhrbacteria bacterium CG_4_9_14_3_um_filter_50_9]|uniref:Uncharacterized protein n=1 Tax=Candidatus Uhrbacteria bacterium CG_4_9_14_3_um_filter_50_9 TaxID=1975035 RepID=A0A2M7XCH4_9BACT|nr:MAG: hypothetical protein CO174_02730 [Candidatus Uhrbacteria bacterium CG_4_9_14_3_um_filter_50_9]